MSELLKRPELFSGRIESFGYEYLSFETRKLAAGAAARRGNRRERTGHRRTGRCVLSGHSAGKLAAYRRTQ